MTLSAPTLPPPSAHDDDDAFVHAFGRMQPALSTTSSSSSSSSLASPAHEDSSDPRDAIPPTAMASSSFDCSSATAASDSQRQHETVLRVSREEENIGARVALSKKRISWRFVIGDSSAQVHTVTLEHSRVSAKKRLKLDGRRLFSADHFCAGDWTYAFRVDGHAPLFTVAIRDVKTTVVAAHSLSLAGIYELVVDGLAWDALGDRVLATARTAAQPVWSSDTFARRVSDESFALAPPVYRELGTARAWVFAFGVLGTIHRLELWILEARAFVVMLDCCELARVSHDAIADATWTFTHTLAPTHVLVVTVPLDSDGELTTDSACIRDATLTIDGSAWRDMSATDFVLQPGWVPVHSRSRGEGAAYFRHTTTHATQWAKPIMARSGATVIDHVPADAIDLLTGGSHDKAGEGEATTAVQHRDSSDGSGTDGMNLLDFSEIAVHASPTHAQAQQMQVDRSSSFAAFDPFDPFDPVHQQQQQQSTDQTTAQRASRPQAPVDLLA